MITSLRIPDELGARLSTLAEKTGRTKSFYILECINAHIDDMEDIYLSLATLERVRRGEEQLHSFDEVKKMLGLELDEEEDAQQGALDEARSQHAEEEKCLAMAN